MEQEKDVWINKIMQELREMDAKTVSLVYFFAVGLRHKGKRKR